MIRPLCSIAVVSIALLMGCGTINHHFEPKPSAEGLPDIKKSPLHAGVYYSPQFASYVQVRKSGDQRVHWHIGPASVAYFDQILPRLFEQTSRTETLAGDELAKKGVDLVIVLSLEHFDYPLGLEPDSERFGVAYRITLCTPRGVPVSSWVVYGTASHWAWTGVSHVDRYIQQAGEKFVRTFERESAPGLAAVASSRQRAPEPIDVAALQLSARHTEPPRLSQDASKQLRDEGFVFVAVSAQPKTSREVVVRASDMRLRLNDGRVIEASSPSALLLIATREATTPIVAGVSPLFGIVATLAMEASVSAGSEERRAVLNNTLGASYFGERVLRADKGEDGGIVFFRLPPKASADGATLIAWALEPASAAGSHVEMPLGAAAVR